MSKAEEIKQALESGQLAVTQQSERRLWAEVGVGKFFEVLDKCVKQLGLTHLCTITGLDEGEHLAFIYHLSGKDGVVLNLKTKVLKDKESLKTIKDYFPGGVIYERELIDLLGVKIEGLPEGLHYPLPDDWPAGQYPLRKDWDPKVLEKKYGV